MSICKDCLHNEVCKYGENRSNGMYCTGEKCKQYKPTADVVEVVHGEWDMVEEEAFWIQNMKESLETGKPTIEKLPVCSICKTKFGTLALDYNYCPECGAKMDGERREENER